MSKRDLNDRVHVGGQGTLDELLTRVPPPPATMPAESGDWPPPATLPEGLPEVPALTADMLPAALRDWLVAEAADSSGDTEGRC